MTRQTTDESPGRRHSPKEKKAAEPGRGPLLAGEYGMRCDVETQVAPDGANLPSWHQALLASETRRSPRSNLSPRASCWLALPASCKSSPALSGNAAPGQPRRYRAVILNLLRVSFGDLPDRPRK